MKNNGPKQEIGLPINDNKKDVDHNKRTQQLIK